ncbi:MAG: hypothetical protein MJ175_03460 [Clostridia bacterium]|nr:hypothetical protein [Clostridia bacterium]
MPREDCKGDRKALAGHTTETGGKLKWVEGRKPAQRTLFSHSNILYFALFH